MPGQYTTIPGQETSGHSKQSNAPAPRLIPWNAHTQGGSTILLFALCIFHSLTPACPL